MVFTNLKIALLQYEESQCNRDSDVSFLYMFGVSNGNIKNIYWTTPESRSALFEGLYDTLDEDQHCLFLFFIFFFILVFFSCCFACILNKDIFPFKKDSTIGM